MLELTTVRIIRSVGRNQGVVNASVITYAPLSQKYTNVRETTVKIYSCTYIVVCTFIVIICFLQ